MGGIRSDKSSARLAPRLLLPLLALLFFDPAQAFINRGYSSLEQTRAFNGDFVDILRQGKLRILLTRDFSSASYLPRSRSPLAEQQRIAVLHGH